MYLGSEYNTIYIGLGTVYSPDTIEAIRHQAPN